MQQLFNISLFRQNNTMATSEFIRRSDITPDSYHDIHADVTRFIGSRGYVYPKNINPFPGEVARIKSPETDEMVPKPADDGILTIYVRVATEMQLCGMPAYFETNTNRRVRLAYTVNPMPKLAYFSHFSEYEFPDDSLLCPTDPRRLTIENDSGVVEEWMYLNALGVRWQGSQCVRYIARTDLLQPYTVTKETETTSRFHYRGNGFTVIAFIPHALRPVTKIRALEFYDGSNPDVCYGKMLHVPSDYKLWFVGHDLLLAQDDIIENHLMVLSDFSVVIPNDQPVDLYVLRIQSITL